MIFTAHQRSCRKVISLYRSVSHYVRGGGVWYYFLLGCLVPCSFNEGVWYASRSALEEERGRGSLAHPTTYPRWGKGGSVLVVCPWGPVHHRVRLWSGRKLDGDPSATEIQWQPPKRLVRIMLECILVQFWFWGHVCLKNSSKLHNMWKKAIVTWFDSKRIKNFQFNSMCILEILVTSLPWNLIMSFPFVPVGVWVLAHHKLHLVSISTEYIQLREW